MAAYSKEHGFNFQTFMYHASRMKKKENSAAEPNAFIRFDVPEKIADGIEYHFAHGSYRVFPVSAQRGFLNNLMTDIYLKCIAK